MASNGEQGLPREDGASEKGSKKRSRKGEGRPLTVSSQVAYLLGSLIYLEVLVASLVGVSSETEVAHFALWTFSIEHDCASELECPLVACFALEALPARWKQQKQNSPFLVKSNQKPGPEDQP